MQKKYKHHPWLKPKDILKYPELHSTPMRIQMVLIVLSDRDEACLGWYFAGLLNEWRQAGSPSQQHPTHWMPLPKKPTTTSD